MRFLITGPYKYVETTAIFLNQYDIEPWSARLFKNVNLFNFGITWEGDTWKRISNQERFKKCIVDTNYTVICVDSEESLNGFKNLFAENNSIQFLYSVEDIYTFHGI